MARHHALPTGSAQPRCRIIARSFYRQLKTEGFTHREIIELSARLLELVTHDLGGLRTVEER